MVPWTPSICTGQDLGGDDTADCDAGAASGEGTDPDDGFRDKNSSGKARTAVTGLNWQFLIICFAL